MLLVLWQGCCPQHTDCCGASASPEPFIQCQTQGAQAADIRINFHDDNPRYFVNRTEPAPDEDMLCHHHIQNADATGACILVHWASGTLAPAALAALPPLPLLPRLPLLLLLLLPLLPLPWGCRWELFPFISSTTSPERL